MSTSNSSSRSVQSPRPGRKLRLAADEGDHLQSASPRSPRKPRTSKSLSRGISTESIFSNPLRSPRRLERNESSSLEDEPHIRGTFASLQRSQLQRNNLPVTTPESMPSHNSKPRLGKTVSWSTDSEEDSPRSTKPLPPISPSQKKDDQISFDEESETIKKLTDPDEETSEPPLKTSPRSILRKDASFETEPVSPERGTTEKGSCKKLLSPETPYWLLQNEPSSDFPYDDLVSLPERAPLPDTSSIFQQALTHMKSRPSLSSDPGDLHVRRSSLVTSFLDLTENKSSETHLSYGMDCLFETMSTVSENDTDKKTPSMLPKDLVSKWVGKPRKISAPSKLVTVHQAPLSSPLTPTPPRRRVVSEIQPPRRELLEGPDKPRPKKATDSMSESSDETSRSSQNYVEEISRPLISGRAMNYVMKFISYATVSDSVLGKQTKPRRLPRLEKPKLPSIQNSGSAWRATNRRDSLRAIQHIINAGNTLGDTTEITNFDDLRNCRYIRDFKPTGKESGAAKHTKYHEW